MGRDRWQSQAGIPEGDVDVAVIGAGPAGLSAARAVVEHAPGARIAILEAGSSIGGRVRTLEREGFLLDRGFQVLNSAYPEVRARLDLQSLGVRPFLSGAAVRHAGAFHLVADPRRHPTLAARTLRSSLGTLGDRLRTARLALSQRAVRYDSPDAGDATAAELLGRAGTGGFGELMLAPFFRGVLLEHDLATSAQKLRWLLHVFTAGPAVLPARGMGAISRQLAAALPDGTIHLDTRAAAIERGEDAWTVRIDGGPSTDAACLIVATEQASASMLLAGAAPDAVQMPSSDVVPTGITHYYALPAAPRDSRPVLLLGTGTDGPITNACVLSNVHDSYAPAGRGLLQATVVPGPSSSPDPAVLEQAVRGQLQGWFGDQVASWELLHVDRLVGCLPFLPPGACGAAREPVVAPGLLVCGDHVDGATLDGALRSGRRAGEQAAMSLR